MRGRASVPQRLAVLFEGVGEGDQPDPRHPLTEEKELKHFVIIAC